MTREDSFLAAIDEAPDDLDRRFVFADWLMEHGDETAALRGELMRAQCEMARTSALWDAEHFLFQARTARILRRIGVASERDSTAGERLLWRRGLPEVARFTQPLEVKKNRRVLVPPVVRLELDTFQYLPKKATELPELARLTEMRINGVRPPGLAALAAGLRRLHTLELLNVIVPEGDMATFARSAAGRRLRSLAVWGDEGAAEGVVAAGRPENLRSLLLHMSAVRLPEFSFADWGGLAEANLVLGGQGAQALVASPVAASLESLTLPQGPAEAEDIAAVLRADLPRLHTLRMSQAGYGGGSAGSHLAGLNLPALARLEWTNSSLGGNAASALARSPVAARFAGLSLSKNDLLGKDLPMLARGDFRALRTLRLADVRCRDGDGVAALAGAAWLRNVELLDLSENSLPAKAAVALASSPNVCGLRVLHLDGTKIGNAGAVALAESPQLGRLEALTLRGCGLGKKGAKALAASGLLDRLAVLAVAEDKENLAEAFAGLLKPGRGRCLQQFHVGRCTAANRDRLTELLGEGVVEAEVSEG
jgi:uncharacterized protein (TIGR02996 family)